MGYGIGDTKEKVRLIGGQSSSDINSDSKAWYLSVEGDEGDFLYLLSFGRGNQKSESTVAGMDVKGEADSELAQAFLGWHGLYWGEVGFGPALLHRRLEIDNFEVEVGGQRGTIASNLSSDTTFAGALMRTETDQFDFSTAVGIDAGSEGWKNGYGLLVGADFHVSDSITLSGGWERAWGEFENGTDVREDIFSLEGRFRIADSFLSKAGHRERKAM